MLPPIVQLLQVFVLWLLAVKEAMQRYVLLMEEPSITCS